MFKDLEYREDFDENWELAIAISKIVQKKEAKKYKDYFIVSDEFKLRLYYVRQTE